MTTSGWSGITIVMMIWSIYFAFLGIGNNTLYNACTEDKEKFFTETPEPNVWGIWKITECNQFKDFRDIFFIMSIPFLFLATIKQQRNVWNKDKAEIIKKYNPSQSPMFYVGIVVISSIAFVAGLYTLMIIQGNDWYILIGIIAIPFVTGSIVVSALKRYWVLKERLKK